MTPIADTHAHLQSKRFSGDLSRVLARSTTAGVQIILNVGTDLDTSRQAVSMVRTGPPALWATVGIHPHDARDATETVYREIARLARQTGVVALGEMGLDYYRDISPRPAQQRCFARQLGMARDLDLPVVIHDRQSTADVYRLLADEGEGLSGVLHCFSAGWDWAERFLDLGFYISLAGPVTYANAGDAREVAKRVPLDRLLVETDCPYLPPNPHRGKRNEPAWVGLVVEEVARIRGLPVNQVASQTFNNARHLFGWGEQE